MSSSEANHTFETLYTHLLTFPAPLTQPSKPHSPSIASKIADLSIHPTLESALHLLNHDLPSAHFLVRHMQSAPAFEGMFLHGILHRIEGDFDNARAWYGNVAESDVFRFVWKKGGLDAAKGFIGEVETLVKKKEGEREGLERRSREEIQAVIEFCRDKFGERRMVDASDAFVKNDERIQKISEEQTTGGKGHRHF